MFNHWTAFLLFSNKKHSLSVASFLNFCYHRLWYTYRFRIFSSLAQPIGRSLALGQSVVFTFKKCFNFSGKFCSYKHLCEIGEHTKEDDETGKKVACNWSVNTGEAIVDLQVVTSLTKKESVLVLGEKYFYCLSSTGRIVFMKRLEYSPLCFHSYNLGR